MPKYTYECTGCEEIKHVWHSISEKLTDCEVCEASGSLKRLPSSFTTKIQKTQGKQRVGDVVKSSIEHFREDLKEEKNKLKNKEYDK